MIKKYISRLLAVIMHISGIIVCPVDDIKAVETSDQGTTVGMEFIEVDEFFDVDDADTDDLHVVDSYAIDIYSTDFYTFDYDTATGTDADVYEEAEYYVYSSTAESYISTKDFSVYGNSYLRNYLIEDEKALMMHAGNILQLQWMQIKMGIVQVVFLRQHTLLQRMALIIPQSELTGQVK